MLSITTNFFRQSAIYKHNQKKISFEKTENQKWTFSKLLKFYYHLSTSSEFQDTRLHSASPASKWKVMYTTQIQRQHPARVNQSLELTAPQGQSECYSSSREYTVSRNSNEPSTHTHTDTHTQTHTHTHKAMYWSVYTQQIAQIYVSSC